MDLKRQMLMCGEKKRRYEVQGIKFCVCGCIRSFKLLQKHGYDVKLEILWFRKAQYDGGIVIKLGIHSLTLRCPIQDGFS